MKLKGVRRGGAINYHKGQTDIAQLTDALEAHLVQEGPFQAFQLGEYNSLGPNQAVRGAALAKIGQLVLRLISVRPDACITYSDLKTAFTNLLLRSTELKPKSPSTFPGDMASRCMVILKHARSLAYGEHKDLVWERAIANVPHYFMTVMNQIRDTIKESESPVAGFAQFSEPNGKNSKGRVLAPHDSNISQASLDEMGLPLLAFASSSSHELQPAMKDPDPTSALVLAAEALGHVPPTKRDLKVTMGLIAKKPACAKRTSGCSKSKSECIMKVKKVISSGMKIDKCTMKLHGPFKNQSYITHMKPPKLVVACTSKQCKDHFQILQQVFDFVKVTPNCTKQEALTKRDHLIA